MSLRNILEITLKFLEFPRIKLIQTKIHKKSSKIFLNIILRKTLRRLQNKNNQKKPEIQGKQKLTKNKKLNIRFHIKNIQKMIGKTINHIRPRKIKHLNLLKIKSRKKNRNLIPKKI